MASASRREEAIKHLDHGLGHVHDVVVSVKNVSGKLHKKSRTLYHNLD